MIYNSDFISRKLFSTKYILPFKTLYWQEALYTSHNLYFTKVLVGSNLKSYFQLTYAAGTVNISTDTYHAQFLPPLFLYQTGRLRQSSLTPGSQPIIHHLKLEQNSLWLFPMMSREYFNSGTWRSISPKRALPAGQGREHDWLYPRQS
jgi:hypothetical protein